VSKKSSSGSAAMSGGSGWHDFWPEAEGHLKKVLRFRLPAGSEAADVIQETAARIHRSGLSLACRDEVLQLATRIAMNIAVDLQRRSRLLSWSPLTSDVRSADDVEREVIAKDQLNELCRRMSTTPEELERLFRCESPDDRSASAKSRRYRTRQRLRRMRDVLGGFAAIPKMRWLLGGVVAAASVLPPATSSLHFPLEHPAGPTGVSYSPADPPSETSETAPRFEDGAYPDKPAPADAPPRARSGSRPPTYKSQVEVRAPGGAGAEKGSREYPDGPPPHLACVRNVAPLPDTCIPHPMRG